MAKKPKFDGPTGLIDPLTGRPVRQFTKSRHYYVRATATRHFWGRVLDGAVFLAAFSVLALLTVPLRTAMQNSPALWELAYDDDFFIFVLMLLWFPALYVYGMIWGKWGLFGDRAARMRSVRITDGTLSGPWIGGWRAVVWSFLPLYAALMIASLFEGGVEHTPGYIPLDLESGVAKGRAPVPDPAIIAKEQAEAQARAQMPHLYGNVPDAR